MRGWRALAVLLGGAMVLIGVVPFTPVIFLLVLVDWQVPWDVRLPFWGTQVIGALVAVCGVGVVWVGFRGRR